jgi:hypothetical protein
MGIFCKCKCQPKKENKADILAREIKEDRDWAIEQIEKCLRMRENFKDRERRYKKHAQEDNGCDDDYHIGLLLEQLKEDVQQNEFSYKEAVRCIHTGKGPNYYRKMHKRIYRY